MMTKSLLSSFQGRSVINNNNKRENNLQRPKTSDTEVSNIGDEFDNLNICLRLDKIESELSELKNNKNQ